MTSDSAADAARPGTGGPHAVSPHAVGPRPVTDRAPLPADAPSDLEWGAFSETPPWVLDRNQLSWHVDIAELRTRTSAQVPTLLARRRVPPVRRVLQTGVALGTAVACWYVVERRRARRLDRPELSRAGLSRRLRKAFEHLGPTYIKLGQILSSGEGLFPAELVSRVPAAA